MTKRIVAALIALCASVPAAAADRCDDYKKLEAKHDHEREVLVARMQKVHDQYVGPVEADADQARQKQMLKTADAANSDAARKELQDQLKAAEALQACLKSRPVDQCHMPAAPVQDRWQKQSEDEKRAINDKYEPLLEAANKKADDANKGDAARLEKLDADFNKQREDFPLRCFSHGEGE
jgi:hypothetical protein